MEINKNKRLVHNIALVVLGVVLGWVVWGGVFIKRSKSVMHVMPDGTMMTATSDMSMQDMMDVMTADLKDKTGNAFDKAFLKEMIPHHQGGVEMAEMVLTKSTRPELLKLASDIISVQQKEIRLMQEWQREWFGF